MRLSKFCGTDLRNTRSSLAEFRMNLRKIVSDKETWTGILIIVGLSLILGLVSNLGLIKRFLGGEFQQAFISRDQFPGLAFITIAETEDLWASQGAVFVDSRPQDEFNRGHIPGAISVPLEEVKRNNREILSRIPEGKLLVVYCEGGDCLTSLNLAKILYQQGFREIRIFSGGWEEWLSSGLPMEKVENHVSE